MIDAEASELIAAQELVSASAGEVTRLLHAWRSGDAGAAERLLPLVYDELRRLARHHLRGERREHTLEPTALVHEAYLRLVEQRRLAWQSRDHFVAVAATMMRRVLLNHARERLAGKRGGGEMPVSLEVVGDLGGRRPAEIVALDDALRSLAQAEPRLAQVVELRLFGGLTIRETARYLEISPATLKRDWQLARAWLRRALRRELR